MSSFPYRVVFAGVHPHWDPSRIRFVEAMFERFYISRDAATYDFVNTSTAMRLDRWDSEIPGWVTLNARDAQPEPA